MFPRRYFPRRFFAPRYFPTRGANFGGSFPLVRQRDTDEIDTARPIDWDYDLNTGTVGWWLAHPSYSGTNRYVDLCNPSATTRGSLITMAGGYSSATSGWQLYGGRPGGFGPVIRYDGTSDYISANHRNEYNVNHHTLAAWIKTTADGKYFLTKNADSFFLGVGIVVSGKLSHFTLGTTPASWLSGATSINDGVWHHVAATYDGVNRIVYVDGKQDGIAATTGTVTTGSDALGIGVRLGTGTVYQGDLDDVRIINRPLSGADIARLYFESRAMYQNCLRRPRIQSAWTIGSNRLLDGKTTDFFPFLQGSY